MRKGRSSISMAARCTRMFWGRSARVPQTKRRTAPLGLQSTGSNLSRAAIDEQLDPRDVTGIVRRQKQHGVGDLIRGTEATQRNGRFQGVLHIVIREQS